MVLIPNSPTTAENNDITNCLRVISFWSSSVSLIKIVLFWLALLKLIPIASGVSSGVSL